MARSTIQPKIQDNRKSSVWIVGGEREKWGEGVGQSLKTGRFLSGYLGGFQMFEYNFFRN